MSQSIHQSDVVDENETNHREVGFNIKLHMVVYISTIFALRPNHTSGTIVGQLWVSSLQLSQNRNYDCTNSLRFSRFLKTLVVSCVLALGFKPCYIGC